MPSVSLVKSTGIFFIIERLYFRDGIIPSKLSLGAISPTLTQIHRTVIRLSLKEQMYMDGEKLDAGNLSLWQTVKYAFGTPVSTKNTGKIIYNMEFSGSLASITLLPDSKTLDIPSTLTKRRVKRPSLMSFGNDPIKDVILYGRSDVKFVMNNGGLDTPIAMAKYNENTKDLHIIKDSASLSILMLDIRNSGVFL